MINILKNNKTSLLLKKNSKSYNRIKYFDIMQLYIKKLVEVKKLLIKQILNTKMLVNNLTKALLARDFKKH